MKTTIITLLIISGILIFQQSYSQIITTDTNFIICDFVPDIIVDQYNKSLKIDINQDSILDIEFYFVSSSDGGYFNIQPLNNNCQFALNLLTSNTDSLVNDKLHWFASEYVWLSLDCPEKLGLKFTFNNKSYYGWLRGTQSWTGAVNEWVHVLTIDKYAFCTIPNYPLLWGQTEIITGTNELKEDTGIKVYTTDSGSQLVVQSGEVIKSIRVIDLLGATVVVKDNIRDKQATLSTKGLVHGTYIVKITNSNLKEYTSKIVF